MQAKRIAAVALLGLLPTSAAAAAGKSSTPRADRLTACLTVKDQPAQTTRHVTFTTWTTDSVKVDGKALIYGEPMKPGGFAMYGEGVAVRASQRGHAITIRASSVLDHPARVCVRAHKTTALDHIESGASG